MKNYLIYTLLLISSFFNVFACVYSPYGEDIRYQLLNPYHYGLNEFQRFFYNANYFDPSANAVEKFDENVLDWFAYLNKKVEPSSIFQFLYRSNASDLNSQSQNQFVKYLYTSKKESVINYLKWAKQCEEFTAFSENKSWERGEEERMISAKSFLKKLQNQINSESDAFLKRRYAFLAIRLAYYADDLNAIEKLFKTHFALGQKDFIYYWSLYFHCFTTKIKDIDLANIVHFSEDKRNAVFYYFRDKYQLKRALNQASSNQERANAYAFMGMQNLGRNLDNIKTIYNLTQYNKQLDFLLMREITKLEDWIYTPYYSYFTPSTVSYYNGDYDDSAYENFIKHAYELKSKGVLNARAYAKEILDFVKSCDLKKVNNKLVWQSIIVQLQFMTQDYDACIQSAKRFINSHAKHVASNQIKQILVLAIVAKQTGETPEIPKEFHDFVLENLDDKYFRFALARELEFLGNYGDAVALMSYQLNDERDYFDNLFWQSQRQENNRGKGQLVEFSDYFSYIDYSYSPDQIQSIIDAITQSANSSFKSKIYKDLTHDKNYISDLLGMKYIRQNDLKAALMVYENMDPMYWKYNYSAWERDEYDGGYYCFDQNPFYQIKYTKDFIEPNAKIKLTKLNVLKQLLFHLERAELIDNPRKDKDYFYIATCYFNMSQYGNSWMMRRFSSTSYFSEKYLSWNKYYEDEEEFRKNELALKYYELAAKHATNGQFKALCIRMQDYIRSIDDPDGYDFSKLIKEFPAYYADLSACENLAAYFK